MMLKNFVAILRIGLFSEDTIFDILYSTVLFYYLTETDIPDVYKLTLTFKSTILFFWNIFFINITNFYYKWINLLIKLYKLEYF